MFTRLAEFRLVRSRRIAPRPHADLHANDNRRAFRHRAAADGRRIPSRALTCHWLVRDGRLECRWHAEANGDAPRADFDDHEPRRTRHAAAFELCCAGVTR